QCEGHSWPESSQPESTSAGSAPDLQIDMRLCLVRVSSVAHGFRISNRVLCIFEVFGRPRVSPSRSALSTESLKIGFERLPKKEVKLELSPVDKSKAENPNRQLPPSRVARPRSHSTLHRATMDEYPFER